ncbi:MAG: glycosyltransferase [Acetivibrionales bacterium]|jgi:cellulose synthase/poly-beta-1,6-N-acetylglucosamine synthase-like glycosyltransferase
MMYFATIMGLLFISFWIAQLVFIRLHLKWSHTIISSDESDEGTGVSIIHPIKDLDFELHKNLETWFNQNYRGKIEHIFSFQDPMDPAIAVVKELKEKYEDMDIRIIVNPVIHGLNGKSSNMVHGLRVAKYDYILFGDSDTRVKEDFIVKMVRPLKDRSVGVTTCGQINIGGKDFWTRYFTFVQNSETDYIWAFLCKLGVDVGITGAAFGMRKEVIQEVGGLEAFGGSLLEDLHLGNTLYRMDYKIVLGPFIECHVDKLEKEKSFNYAKRIATGVKAHIAFELPAFILMLFWYWILFIIGTVTQNFALVSLTLVFMGIRTIHGLLQRAFALNRIMPVDIIMPLFFDLFGTFYLLYSFNKPEVSWRGIKYEVRAGGYINDVEIEESALEE